MAFTGVLGTKEAQPGSIVLGSGFAGGVPQTVVSTITVSDTVAFEVAQGPHKRLTDSITVTSVASAVRDRPQTVTSSIVVSSAQVAVLGPFSFVTQAVTEVIYTMTQNPFITQFVAEVVYKKANAQSVTDTISVTSTPGTQFRSVRMFVTDSIVVGQTPFGRNTIVRMSVVTSISVSVPTVERDQLNHQNTSDSITVLQTIGEHSNPIHMFVTDTIHIIMGFPNPVTERVTPVRLTVTDHISVLANINGGSSQRAMNVVDNVRVTTSTVGKQIYFSVEDSISVSQICWGGISQRSMSIVDTITVTDANYSSANPRRMSVTDTIIVTTTRGERSPVVRMDMSDQVTVFQTIGSPTTSRKSIKDTIAVDSLIGKAPNNNHQAITDHLLVIGGLRFSPVREIVVDTVTVSPRATNFDLEVRHNITVSTNLHKNLDADLTDTLTTTQTLERQITFVATILDPLTTSSLLSRAVEWGRSFTDTLHIAESNYPKTIDFLGDPIYVPVAVGTLVSNHVILRSPSAVITLPAPQMNNELANVAGVQIQRSMNAKTLVFKQSSTRQKLKYTFRLDKAKAFELRKFVSANFSNVLNLETWDAQIWVGYITNDPFELQNAGRSAPADEFSTVELDFEGTKLSG